MTRNSAEWLLYTLAFATTLFLVLFRVVPRAVSLPLWITVVAVGVLYFGRKTITAKRAGRGTGGRRR